MELYKADTANILKFNILAALTMIIYRPVKTLINETVSRDRASATVAPNHESDCLLFFITIV